MRPIYLLFFLFIFQISSGQTITLKSSTPLIVDQFIGIDSYKNTYFIKDRVLHKKGEEGDFSYNNLQLGRIASVDIINPLKLVVFFEDTNTAVLLDNKLSEIQRISFHELSNFLNAGTATTAENNGLWIFNIDSQQLELYNYKTRSQTTVSLPFSGKVLSQASNFNFCFILTEKKLRAFNVYGSFLNEIDSNGYERIVQQSENVLALKNNSLFYIKDFAQHKTKTGEPPLEIKIPEIEIIIQDLQLTKEFLYIYDGKNLHTYTLTLPKKE